MSGFRTLFYKELLRFWKVSFQTVLAPVITALLYLTIFGHALRGHVEVYPGVGYTSFLIPGLVMMSVLQNAFANSSSSLIQSKITGNLVFVLLPPLSHYEMFAAYVLAAVARGLAVGFGVETDGGSLGQVHVAINYGAANTAASSDADVRKQNRLVHFTIRIHAHIRRQN